jgi:hypothetical protein
MPSAFRTILGTGLLAGTLDLLAAIVVYSILAGRMIAVQILQGIASGLFGGQAFSGGTAMVVWGVVLHYIIAFSFTIVYFLAFPHVPFLRRHKIVSGLLYGVLVWCIMNLIVLPLSNVEMSAFTVKGVLRGMVILMLMIGLPVSLLTHRYYTGK